MSTGQQWVAQSMTFLPYIFRAIRLRRIFAMADEDLKPLVPFSRRLNANLSMDLDREATKERKVYCVKNREIRYYLYVCLLPGILFFLISLIPAANFLPTLEISECFPNTDNYYSKANKIMLDNVYFSAVHNLVFFTILFALRDIQDDFNISGELRRVVFISSICLQFYTFSLIFLNTGATDPTKKEPTFVSLGYSQYILVLMSLSLLYFTSLKPILKTYNPQKGIIPYSLTTDMLRNMESAVTQPLPSTAFYNYLANDQTEPSGLLLFTLYADLRRYLAVCAKLDAAANEQKGKI